MQQQLWMFAKEGCESDAQDQQTEEACQVTAF